MHIFKTVRWKIVMTGFLASLIVMFLSHGLSIFVNIYLLKNNYFRHDSTEIEVAYFLAQFILAWAPLFIGPLVVAVLYRRDKTGSPVG